MILKQIGKFFKWQAELSVLGAVDNALRKNFTDDKEVQAYHEKRNEHANVLMRMTDTSPWIFYMFYSLIGLFLCIIGILPKYKNINIGFYICIALTCLFLFMTIRQKLRLKYYQKLIEKIIVLKIRKIDELAKRMNKTQMQIIKDLTYVSKEKYIIDLYVDIDNNLIVVS